MYLDHTYKIGRGFMTVQNEIFKKFTQKTFKKIFETVALSSKLPKTSKPQLN